MHFPFAWTPAWLTQRFITMNNLCLGLEVLGLFSLYPTTSQYFFLESRTWRLSASTSDQCSITSQWRRLWDIVKTDMFWKLKSVVVDCFTEWLRRDVSITDGKVCQTAPEDSRRRNWPKCCVQNNTYDEGETPTNYSAVQRKNPLSAISAPKTISQESTFSVCSLSGT